MVDEHTPEPWRISPELGDVMSMASGIKNDIVCDTAQSRVLVKKTITKEDARRIVACVNACAGISTAALEQAAKTYRVDADRLWRMEKLFKAAFKGVTEQ